MRTKRIILAAWLLAFLVIDSLATDRYFRNITRTSPNGRYQATAKSPHNKPNSERRAFQRDFSYSLSDKENDKRLWVRQQPSDEEDRSEGSPVNLFVSDQGWVVIWTGWNELIAVGPKGRDICRLNILDEALPKKDVENYSHWSTAGPRWGSGFAHFYFAIYQGKDYFCLRTWWDRRVILDLSTGKQVLDEGKLHEALIAEEKEFVLSTLREAAANLDKFKCTGDSCFPENTDEWFTVATAALMSGRMQITNSINSLQKLESANLIVSSWVGGQDLDLQEGDINPFAVNRYGIRPIVQLSLRRLGKKPACLPALTMGRHKEKGSFPSPDLPTPRSERVDIVEADMQPEDVVGAIGYPDYFGYGDSWISWEYDIDATPPYTFVAQWKEIPATGDKRKLIINKTERISPPRWKAGNVRDQSLIY